MIQRILHFLHRESGNGVIMRNNLTMKELPDTERPYEKCMEKGPQALSDAELISVIIRTGSGGESALVLAQRILKLGDDGILNLAGLSVNDLLKIPGIGPVKAIQLKCVVELSKRISMARRGEQMILSDASSIAEYYMEQMRHETREILIAAMFNIRNAFLGDVMISVGTAHASLISPAEIFRRALIRGAASIVLLHNHPSGVPAPSQEDMEVTKRVAECGELLGVPLMDHIIIGDNRYYSFSEMDHIRTIDESYM